MGISIRKAEIGAVYNYELCQHHKIMHAVDKKKVIGKNRDSVIVFCFYCVAVLVVV